MDDANDEVIGMICVQKEDLDKRMILVVSEKGFGKKTPIDEYRTTNRGGKGVKTISITEKTGNLVGILTVSDEEDLMITCKSGITIRTGVDSIREAGRATQGVKLIRLEDDDAIAAVTQMAKEEEEENLLNEEGADVAGEISTETNEPDAEQNQPDDAAPLAEDAGE
ncbi:DNA gyrase C-terminal beta-propeller domain-containing protein [Phnomibacter ginsenosidimutans]|uniref:DNA gyrase C-terminal beta-propeller domain-containing protein n=1 Tax=Phnomibacter ginsenosidimutans TaxID=2676868 RepID=UPI001FE80150|nr:DNA gyrase C-terminal beta-propeller domain-containing protein [Phnomibacter ginsenosidimutans]